MAPEMPVALRPTRAARVLPGPAVGLAGLAALFRIPVGPAERKRPEPVALAERRTALAELVGRPLRPEREALEAL